MRIIAGINRGATIFAPPGVHTRPTADKVRGAIFNMLGDIEGLAVLDLFAGSGSLGLEALSRGASRAVFVESQAAALKTINRNVTKLTVKLTEPLAEEIGVQLPENHPEEIVITSTVNTLDHQVSQNIEIRRRDYLAYLRYAAKISLRFDLIFIDPPYRMHRVIEPELGRWIPAVISPGARVVVESDSRHEIMLPGELVKDKVYGDTRVRIFIFP